MREPVGVSRRLLGVRPVRMSPLLVVALAGLLLAQPALAQSTAEIDASVGLDGWIDPDVPFQLDVTISTDVLVDGSIEATVNSLTVSTPAQIPAGSTKAFSLTMPPPTSGGNIQVKLLDTSGASVAVARVNPRYPTNEVLVGVGSGADAISFDRLRTPIVDRPIASISIGETDPVAMLDYLVTDSFDAREEEFALDGGVVVTESSPTSGTVMSSLSGITRFSLGAGEVLVVDDVSDVEAYRSELRAGPLRRGVRDFWQSPEQYLTEAASNSGDGGVPELPWLLTAIIGYALLIGPINFVVLHRVKRRDLAWVTIPAISLVSLLAFWLVGGQRLEDASVNHSALVVGGSEAIERSSVVLSVGREGRFAVDFEQADVAYPWNIGNRFDEFGQPLATAASEVSGSTVTFELQQLGFAAASSIGPAPSNLPDVAVATSEAGVTSLVVDNDTGLSFWAWGVYSEGQVTAGTTSLAAGATDSLESRGGAFGDRFGGQEWGWSLGDAVINQLQLWDDDRGWRVLSPLGQAAQFMFDSQPDQFFFGFTEDYQPSVSIDGQDVDSSGMTLVIVPVEAEMVDRGQALGEILSVGDGTIQQEGPGFTFVFSNQIWLGFELPAGVVSPQFRFLNQFGEQPLLFEVWNWETGVLEEVLVGELVDARFVDGSGRIVMRAGSAEDVEFMEFGMSADSFVLSWGDT